MCRWKTVESVNIYGKMGSTDYADWVDVVTKTDAHPARHLANEIVTDPRQLFEEFNSAIDTLQNEHDYGLTVIGNTKSSNEKEAKEVDAPTTTTSPEVNETISFNCGEEGDILCTANTSSLVGKSVKILSSEWPCFEGPINEKTTCTIVGYCKSHKMNGTKAPGVYVVDAEGEYYAFRKNFYAFKNIKK